MINGTLDFLKWKKKILQDKSNIEIIQNKRSSTSLLNYYQDYEQNNVCLDICSLFDKEVVDTTIQKSYFDPTILGKTNSLPSKVGYFTTPHNILGQIQGESIFRYDYESRGPNNKQKENYMKALRRDDLLKYQQVIRKYLRENANLVGNKYNLVNKCNKICTDLFYLLHFSIMPTDEDYQDVKIFLQAITDFPFQNINNLSSLRQINNLKSFYQKSIHRMNKLRKNKKHCLVSKWMETDLTDGDIFIELIHNILAMVSNWFNTLHPYLLHISQGTIPKINSQNDTRKYLHECFRFITPVAFATSNIKNPKKFKENIKKQEITDNINGANKIQNKIKDIGNYIHLYLLKSMNYNKKLWGDDTDKFKEGRFDDLPLKLDTLMNNNKSNCPFFETSRNCKVDCELPIYERDGYMPFGDGYRRCPGEFITMIFLEEIARFIEHKEVIIKPKIGIIKNIKYIWGLVDTDLEILIR